MSRRLDDLHPLFLPKAIELLARCVEATIPVMIVDTLRTEEEHKANLAAGRSWTLHSKHLDGLAIDICPFESFQLYGPDKLRWDANDPVWAKLAAIGESLGLTAGYRWKVRDCGHFELP